MEVLIKSFLTGAVVGFVFSFMKLPIPAPNVLAGVVGIIGIFVGYYITTWIK